MRYLRYKTYPAWLFLSLIVVIAGCSYDNSLYNARKYFRSAQARALTQAGKPTPQAVDEYTKTIKKCGFILTERKDSSEADDALFLLAQALFFKGNGQYQARDQFQSLIKNFPNSPYVPQSIMFIARINREINEKQEAENILTNFVRQPDKAEWHPQAISLLADFAIQDKDFIEAEFWLDKLITQFPKTQQGKEAPILLGKILYEQQDYTGAIKQFNKVLNTRGVQGTLKLDARYNIALNYLMLNDTKQSYALTKKLLKDETRPEKITLINVLLGRVLLALSKEQDTIELYESVIKSNNKTAISAEANYWLAEFYYYEKNDILKALDYYNKAKSELSTSPFFTVASQKHAALIALNQNSKIRPEPNPQIFVESRLAIAEDYYSVFKRDLTAFAVIDNIALIPQELQLKADSLLIKKSIMLASVDSLQVLKQNLLVKVPADSVFADSLKVDSSLQDSTKVVLENTTETVDTLAINAKINKLNIDMTNLDKDIQKLSEFKELFEKEFIPFSMFFKATMIYKRDKTSEQVTTIYNNMYALYPINKYTVALKLLLEGKPVRLVDIEYEQEENELDKALAGIYEYPDSAIVSLQKLTFSQYQDISNKANFRLGWHYTFEQFDSTQATKYLSEVIKSNRTSDYSKVVLRFFDGSRFTFLQTKVDSVIVIPDSLADSLSIKDIKEDLDETGKELDNDKLEKDDFIPELKEYNEFLNPLTPVIKPDDIPPVKP
jgi:TolA-binding protein